MKNIFLSIIIITLIFLKCSISHDNESANQISIREHPCYQSDSSSNGKSLILYFTIETKKDTADSILENQLDSFVCKLLPKYPAQKYFDLTFYFIKETEDTKAITSNDIGSLFDDCNLDKITLLEYSWINYPNSNLFKKIVNRKFLIPKTNLNCN